MTDESIVTKDYWTIVLLTSAGYSPIKIESNERESGSIEKVYHFPIEATETYRDYIAGRDIPINFHDMERAATLFKKNLHRRD